MDNLIPIGKFCKTMDISHRTLRYHEEQGLFMPAYVNKETGYRYYKPEQLITLYLILQAVEVGMPLASIKSYFNTESSIDRGAFTLDAIKMAKQKAEKINREITYLTNVYEDLQRNDDCRLGQGVFTKHINVRYFLTYDYPNGFKMINIIDTHIGTTKLNKQAKELGLNTLSFEGFLFINNNKNKCQVIREIPHYVGGVENLITVPAGDFCCEHLYDVRVEQEFTEHLNSKFDYLIMKKNYRLEHSWDTIYFEIQKI